MKLLFIQIKYDGVSGKIEFDNAGVRSNISIDILELTENGLEAVGNWKYIDENPSNRLKLEQKTSKPTKYLTDDFSLRNKTLTVITALVII